MITYFHLFMFAVLASILGAAFSVIIKKIFGLEDYQSFTAVGLSFVLGIIALQAGRTIDDERVEALLEEKEILSNQIGDQQLELSVLRGLDNMDPYMKDCCMRVLSYGCMSSKIVDIGGYSSND